MRAITQLSMTFYGKEGNIMDVIERFWPLVIIATLLSIFSVVRFLLERKQKNKKRKASGNESAGK